MTEITISESALSVSGRLIAGDTILIRLNNIELPADARVRLVMTAVPPPDARHVVATSELMSLDAPESKLLLKSAELREAFTGAHVSESLQVMLEACVESHAIVLATLRSQVENSAALWRGTAQKNPIPDPIYALADDLRSHVSRTDNPHGVTAAQVGADVAGAAEAAVAAHDADLAAHADIRSAVAAAEGVAAEAQSAASGVAAHLAAHEAARGNPHGVTEAQVRAASSARVFGALELDNIWTGGNLSRVAEVTARIKAADDEGGGLPLASVYHVTAADSGDGPAAYLSGIAKNIPVGTVSNVLLVFENDSSAARTHTLFFDVWRVFSRGIVSEGSPYLPASQLSAGAFALISITLWKLAYGRVAAIINDFIRTDWKDVYQFMTAKIFDNSGNVWALVADSDGGMHTEPIS